MLKLNLVELIFEHNSKCKEYLEWQDNFCILLFGEKKFCLRKFSKKFLLSLKASCPKDSFKHPISEAFSEPCQTFKMESLVEIVTDKN